MKKKLQILIVALPVLALLWKAGYRVYLVSGERVRSCRDVVDAFVALQPRDAFTYPARIEFRSGQSFDVEDYFTALTHLSMEEGYKLYFVYHYDQFCGEPTLKALGLAATGAKLSPSGSFPSEFSCMGGPNKDDPESWRHEYLKHVRVDGTEQGYFEYVVLYLMGERFYQYWHALYNDYDVVCDSQSLDRLMREDEDKCIMPGLTTLIGKGVSLAPVVWIGEDTVRVRLVVHSWGEGLNEEIYTLRRSLPHTILERVVRPVAPSLCVLTY